MQKSGYSGNGGFTLVELMVAVSIAGLIAAWAVVSVLGFVAEKSEERLVVSMWKDIKGLRMKALKTENVHIVRFGASTTNGKSYQIFQKPASGANIDITSADVPTLLYGVPTNCPGLPGGGAVAGGGIAALWADPGLEYNNDFMGRIINPGYVMIKSRRNASIGYCILASATNSSQDLKLFKCRGGSWFEM